MSGRSNNASEAVRAVRVYLDRLDELEEGTDQRKSVLRELSEGPRSYQDLMHRVAMDYDDFGLLVKQLECDGEVNVGADLQVSLVHGDRSPVVGEPAGHYVGPSPASTTRP